MSNRTICTASKPLQIGFVARQAASLWSYVYQKPPVRPLTEAREGETSVLSLGLGLGTPLSLNFSTSFN